jgi:hypothetical protein
MGTSCLCQRIRFFAPWFPLKHHGAKTFTAFPKSAHRGTFKHFAIRGSLAGTPVLGLVGLPLGYTLGQRHKGSYLGGTLLVPTRL